MERWQRIDEIVGRIEQVFLGVLLATMIVIAFSQIVLRNVFSTGLAWGDGLVRNLVLWCGFIGAAIAAREGKHISVDVVSQWLSPKKKAVAAVVTHAFSLVVCLLLLVAALKFLNNELQMGSILFLGIPAWVSEIIIPITFAVMAFRFLLHFLKALFTTDRQERPQ